MNAAISRNLNIPSVGVPKLDLAWQTQSPEQRRVIRLCEPTPNQALARLQIFIKSALEYHVYARKILKIFLAYLKGNIILTLEVLG
jgi:hypothetical protein